MLGLIALMFAAPSSADVVSANPHGFEIRHVVEVKLPPAAAYRLLGQPARWWSKDHSYSGDAANFSMELKPGGCFCESLKDGGGVEHARVVVAMPGSRAVLTGSFGPLLYEATTGVMDWQFAAVSGGTRVTMTYRAAGFANGNGDKLAPLVDQVLGEQVKRFAAVAR